MNQGDELFFVWNVCILKPLFNVEIFEKENNGFPVVPEIFKTIERKGF